MLTNPQGQEHPLIENQTLSLVAWKVSGKSKGLIAEGVSTRAPDFIMKARRDGTRANYESAWGKWVRWWGEREAYPYECGLNLVLDYLASLFEKGYEYRTINSHRSAISIIRKSTISSLEKFQRLVPSCQGFSIRGHLSQSISLSGIRF